MKKILLFSVVSLFLLSCSSDDDAAPTVDPTVGTWRMTAFEVENSYDFNGDGTASRDLITETNCYQNETILFSSNGAGTASSNSSLTVIGELVAGTTDEYTYTLNCENETDVFQLIWTVNGSTLTISDEDGLLATATLTSNNQFSYTISSGFEIFSSGFNGVISEEDVTITYTKL